MSYTVSAPQAKLFGFTPKYVWDDFTVEHAVLARLIKKQTFALFMDIEDKEMEIKTVSTNILNENGIDLMEFRQLAMKQRRTALKQARLVEAQMLLDQEGADQEPVHLELYGDATNPAILLESHDRGEEEHTTDAEDADEEVQVDSENQFDTQFDTQYEDEDSNSDGKQEGLSDEIVSLLQELEKYRDGHCDRCASKDRELEALRADLRECQRERDLWRRRYMEMEGNERKAVKGKKRTRFEQIESNGSHYAFEGIEKTDLDVTLRPHR